MGGVCSAGIPGDKSPTELSFRAMGFVVEQEFRAFSAASKNRTAPVEEATEPEQVSDIGLALGRKSTSGLGKAVEVLDNLSSSMTSLSPGGGFVSAPPTKGNKITILAFEVANTIVKGMSLMQSLSKESLKYLKDTVLLSEGVQRLVSSNMDDLMRIAAADKRQELRVFSREVIRFGNRCKDPQWHNLDRYFSKLESEITPQPELKEMAKADMQQLMTLVRYTGDLYHELHALDRFEQDYRRKLEEEKRSVTFERGDTVQIIRQELKSQRKHVHSLKKKSLWSKVLDDVMEKLVDIVHFLHVEIQDTFGPCDGNSNESQESRQTLGSAGLSLHYANIISQIDNIVPITQIRCSMEKTLQWIVPVANNTARNDLSRKQTGQPDVLKIETLYHADKERTEACILDLVVWLHHLISYSRPNKGGRSPSRSPARPGHAAPRSPVSAAASGGPAALTQEDREMLLDVYARRRSPGKSKSQELSAPAHGAGRSALSRNDRLSRSSGSHCPSREHGGRVFPLTTSRSPAASPVVHFDIDRIRALVAEDRMGRTDVQKQP
ncbi:uncharacterized protein C2845_PM11G07590 [Panicum miliaceum]|uniref:DUF3475 domain-containing protein n=1 Tax=Panicum miliaceum TaxID=4540 RepID=A0A3L6RPU6_PANMI|nr:uncharacterized protein C2845_PM11G07590 [Panicum miliaceum]